MTKILGVEPSHSPPAPPSLSDLLERLNTVSPDDRTINRDLYWRFERRAAERCFWNASTGLPKPLGDAMPEGLGKLAVELSAPAYVSSIDAAIGLVVRLLPGWAWSTSYDPPFFGGNPPYGCKLRAPKRGTHGEGRWVLGPTFPRAILAALLTALAAGQSPEGSARDGATPNQTDPATLAREGEKT
jgi:hypothetical protein